MKTYFACPERAKAQDLTNEIDIVGRSPIVTGLLHCVGGLLAILNEQRQLVALNESFLRHLGIKNPETAMGLRLGEVLHCVHAHDAPAGCGTTRFCSTCGAALALAASLAHEGPAEHTCALQAVRNGKTVELALLARAQTIEIGGGRFILLFIQDITQQQHRASLERTFYHDINNQLCLLVCASELLASEAPSDLANMIRDASLRLSREVEIQRCLSAADAGALAPEQQSVAAHRILDDLQRFFAIHPVAHGKRIRFEDPAADPTLSTDPALLFRVLCNMIINAFEATEPQGEVIVWMTQELGSVTFCVWNGQPIPEDVARRVFQRNFSTKPQAGRGFGTYSMKLFGEKYLNGSVTFSSSPEEGTVFRMSLPCSGNAAAASAGRRT